MSDLFWRSDAQMARLQPNLPKSHGTPRVDGRRVLSVIIFIYRNGLRWRDAPKAYGAYNCWKRWSDKGIFAAMMAGGAGGLALGADGHARFLPHFFRFMSALLNHRLCIGWSIHRLLEARGKMSELIFDVEPPKVKSNLRISTAGWLVIALIAVGGTNLMIDAKFGGLDGFSDQRAHWPPVHDTQGTHAHF